MKIKIQIEYKTFVEEIKQRVREAQYTALRAVNKELIGLYWDIGCKITEKQKILSWGKSVVASLARELQKEFPGIKGFSERNIWYMRNFYQMYVGNVKLQPLVAEIGWAKHLVIMSHCKKDDE